jgi:hypothetical protein
MAIPSRAAYEKLNRYLAGGGMILFDTRDADLGGFGTATPEGERLQVIARGLDIPAIEPIPADHVLTRTFYLLQEFPGRWNDPAIWVEASPPDAAAAEGMPFRDLNDGVTPVVIGGNDWAGGLGGGRFGHPAPSVGRGQAGEGQREYALRFGVNLVMHVLTGNYKSDQVHVPAPPRAAGAVTDPESSHVTVDQIVLDPLLPWPVVWAAVALVCWPWRSPPGGGFGAGGCAASRARRSSRRSSTPPCRRRSASRSPTSWWPWWTRALAARADRGTQAAEALAHLEAEVAGRDNTELRVVRVGDADGRRRQPRDGRAGRGLGAGAAGAGRGRRAHHRRAGARLPAAPQLRAPLHVLLTGQGDDWDRRLVVRNAPAFGILDEELTLTVRIEDQGAAPGDSSAPLTIAIDGGPPMRFDVPLGEDMELPLVLPHAGMNVLQFETPLADGELTDRNNAAVVQINGVRDRLRVLLVSGEPHPGERTWRNLLKSDPSVDLVHFTILRPPEKQDGVPVEELSLIAFPTYELFVEKLEDFDLVVFDRYRRQGILPNEYLQNVADYVARGGAVLVSGGPEYASAESIFRSPLGAVLPGEPTARVVEEGFVPRLSELGQRHPSRRGSRHTPARGGRGRHSRLGPLVPPDRRDPHARGRRRHGGARGPSAPAAAARGEGRAALLADRPRLAVGPRLRGRRGRN